MIQRRTFLLASAALIAVPKPLIAASGDRHRDQKPNTIVFSELRAPIEIVEDELGIPHVRAASLHDAYFGQGYLVARDRLFQIDLNYRRSMGRMAESFGPQFVPADRAARLFHYRGC